MSEQSYDHLKAQWPGRYTLNAEETALVLNGRRDKASADWIRQRMKRGDLKGAHRDPVGGGWRISIPDLAEIIEPAPERPSLPKGPRQAAQPKRRRARLGPSLAFIRAGRFFIDVYQALGWQDQVVAMKGLLDEEEAQLRKDYAERQRELLAASTVEPRRVKGRDEVGL